MIGTLFTPGRWFGKGNLAAARVHSRHACCMSATMIMVDRDYRVDGLVLEISRGGVLFREASSFILDRTGTAVEIRAQDYVWRGTVVNVRPEGYGVRLTEPLADDVVDDVLSRFGVADAA